MALSPYVQRLGENIDVYFGEDTGDIPASSTDGTYKTGDQIIFTAAGTGEAPGAYCIAGGTPGTWEEFSPLVP